MLYAFCLFHLHRQVGAPTHLPAYEDGKECFETSAYKIQTPGHYPKESIQQTNKSSIASKISSLEFVPDKNKAC